MGVKRYYDIMMQPKEAIRRLVYSKHHMTRTNFVKHQEITVKAITVYYSSDNQILHLLTDMEQIAIYLVTTINLTHPREH
jgi:hypothetical protein